MDSGKLDKKIVIYKATPVKNSSTGTLTNTPALQVTTWAQMIVTESTGSSLSIEAGEANLNDEVKWKIRKWAAFTPTKTMYVLYGGLKYYIHRVKDKNDINDPYYYLSTTVKT